MKKRIIAVLVFCLFIPSLSFAAKVYLKDGKMVEGNILSKTSYYVVIQVGPIPQKYYLAQVDRIEEDRPVEKLTDKIDTSGLGNISTEKAKLILMLLEANGTKASLDKNIDQALKTAPAQVNQLRQLFNAEEIMKAYVPIFDKYYSEEDLKTIVQFYQSPAGKRMIEVTPSIIEETLKVSVEYFQKKATSLDGLMK